MAPTFRFVRAHRDNDFFREKKMMMQLTLEDQSIHPSINQSINQAARAANKSAASKKFFEIFFVFFFKFAANELYG
jgi:hypothetical protein